ncbi:MAG TPA: hypothetical protein VKY80_08020 [Croceibacterium sp.]|nr:hypothetical protein [Croceibacterium sp.]
MLLAVGLLGSIAALLALGAIAWRWLAKSWQVIDEDRIAPSSRSDDSIIHSWFGLKPRRLTYRRDARGRFRRHRR